MQAFYFTLGLVFQALPFVIAFVLALAFIFFCFGAYNSPVVAVWVGATVYVMTNLGANTALNLGLNLSLADFYFGLLGGVMGLRILAGHLPPGDRIRHLWLLMALVWGALFIIGAAKFKKTAGVEFRATFYILTSVIYLMTFRLRAEQVGRIFQALHGGALALAGLALYRWGAIAVGEYGFWYDPVTPLRVLDSSATFVIAVAMLPGLAMWLELNERRTGMMLVAPCLLLVVMVLGHRTVWVATLAGLGAIWWLAGRKRRGNKAGVLVPVGIGALVLAALFVLAPQSTVTREFERSVAETQQKNSTLAWRVDSWKSLLDDWVAGGPLVWPAGKPFGSGNRRYVEAQRMETNVGAHSHYISLLTRGGLLVLGAYVAAQILTLRRLLTRSVDAPPWLNAEILAVFFIANMVYALAYGPDYMQALFMGLGYALAARAGPAPACASPASASPQVMSDASRRLAHLS